MRTRTAIAMILLFGSAALSVRAQCNLTVGMSPSTLSCSPAALSIGYTANFWNLVGLASSTANWDLAVGPALSLSVNGSTAFVISNGNLGTPGQMTGTANRLGSTGSATLQRMFANSLTLNAAVNATIPAGDVATLYEFRAPVTGTFQFLVTGGTPFNRYAVFSPSTSANWRTRGQAMIERMMGQPATLTLAEDSWYSLVLFRENGTLSTAQAFTVTVTSGEANFALSLGTTRTATHLQQAFTFTPAPGWNAIGVSSSSDWDLSLGGASSQHSSSAADFVVANGTVGPIASSIGLLERFAGAASASVQHVAATDTVSVGTWHDVNWPSSRVLQVWQLPLTETGHYDFQASGPASIEWDLFPAGSSAAWRARNSAIRSGSANSTQPNLLLGSGDYVLVFSRQGGIGAESFGFRVRRTPNPVPVLSSVTPASMLAGSPQTTLALTGSGFIQASEVHWDGTPLLTSLLGPTMLEAALPTNLLIVPGPHAVTVFNPAPAGGTSASRTVTLLAPEITALNPPAMLPLTASSPGVYITVSGINFTPLTVVYANGTPLVTLSQGTTQLTCFVDASIPQATIPGGIALNAVNFPKIASNTVALMIGAANNRGTIVRAPLQPLPGQPYAVKVEGGQPGSALTLAASLGAPATQTQWPDAAANMVLSLDVGTLIPVVDGLGVFGPPSGAAFGPNPQGTAPGGVFTLPGFVLPAQPLGIDLTVQAAYLDATSPAGFRLTWARWPDRL